MDPKAVGAEGSSIVIGKHSGRAAFKFALDKIGIQLDASMFEAAFRRMKEIADQSGEISDSQLRAIVDEVVSGIEVLEGVASSFQ
jgi:2-isopropylmalate synthase